MILFFSTKGNLGTGLGLSQVYGFVGRCNGAIKVYSELGHGTCFKIFLPATNQQATVAKSFVISDVASFQGTEKILVVDDELDMANLAGEILSQQGYHVFIANNGVQAIELLKEESIDLVVTDVIMPHVDGYQLAEHMQKHFPQTKIQMVSGFVDGRHHKMADSELHRNMVHKPYVSHELLGRVRSVLDEGGTE